MPIAESSDAFLAAAYQRVVVQRVSPEIDGGRFAVKRTVGDRLIVTADLVADGHDLLVGQVVHRHEAEPAERRHTAALSLVDNDRYAASIPLHQLGSHLFTVEAWVDDYGSYQRSLEKRAEAGQELDLELRAGAELLEAAARRAGTRDKESLLEIAATLSDSRSDVGHRLELALSTEAAEMTRRWPDPRSVARYDRWLEVVVDPEVARFGAWYEFFPRSCGPQGRHGTFDDAAQRLEYIAKLGFDVVYLPPIHPIGRTSRKGPNNSLTAGPRDPGSPWAIGAKEGGHKAIHPELGGFEAFERFQARAAELGLRIALDIAFQASPDHPYVQEHPEWFKKRPDGTIRFAENPPKKYQDIFPFDFESEAATELWEELESVFLFWIDRGIRIFRVDNPHTKSLRFWEWCIRRVKHHHPDVVFLSEAFTRPKLMYTLAKLGFTQSYTYFTWRITKQELEDYSTELTRTEVAEFFRPSFWPNTPDILPPHLQSGHKATFRARALLASMLSSNYGVYGPAFELLEHVPRPGSEEYVDNEKYQLRSWDLDAPKTIAPLLQRINRIRRAHPALQWNRSLRFHGIDNDQILSFSKRTEDRSDVILVFVSIDPHHTQSGFTELDLSELGLGPEETFRVEDLLSGVRYEWRGARNFVKLDPGAMPAHVFHLHPIPRNEASFEHYR